MTETDTVAEDQQAVHSWHASTFIVATVVAFAADQVSKWWARSTLEGVTDVFWTLKLHVTQNSGSAFSLGLGRGRWIGIGVIIISILLVRFARTVRSHPATLGLGMVLGGALGNLADRFFGPRNGFLGGSVTDFIEMVPWWPVFNIADVAIVIGVGIIVVVSLRAGEDGL